MKARQEALKNFMKFLHKSEAGRFAPKEEPKPAEAPKEDFDADTQAALQAIIDAKD